MQKGPLLKKQGPFCAGIKKAAGYDKSVSAGPQGFLGSALSRLLGPGGPHRRTVSFFGAGSLPALASVFFYLLRREL